MATSEFPALVTYEDNSFGYMNSRQACSVKMAGNWLFFLGTGYLILGGGAKTKTKNSCTRKLGE